MGTEVKWMHSGMTGAPSLAGVAGNMIALLDACLVNGFGSGTVDSVVVSSSVATVTRSAGHPFELDTVVEISGATPSGLNGQKRVLSATGTTYTFDATGVADGTASGTITHKVAAAGWTKQYNGTNLAAYKSPNVAATGFLLRVDDTGTTNARVFGYETMSDINTGTGQFPSTAQQSGGLYWPKSNAADATARSWVFAGDDRAFYLYVAYQTAAGTHSLTMGFGDFTSKKSSDAYACFIDGSATAPTNAVLASDVFYGVGSVNSNNGLYVPKAYTSLGSSVLTTRVPSLLVGLTGLTGHSGAYSAGITYPNLADNGLYVVPMYIAELQVFNILRGVMPGAYYSPMVGVNSGGIAHRDRIIGVSGLSGRALRAIQNAGNNGVGFIDVTGPWR